MNELCENCKTEPATHDWGGNHDALSLARNRSLIQRWCQRCMLTAQVAYMRDIAAKLQTVERELAALDGQPLSDREGTPPRLIGARAEIQRIRDEAEIVSEFLREGPINLTLLRRASESFYRVELALLDYYELLAERESACAPVSNERPEDDREAIAPGDYRYYTSGSAVSAEDMERWRKAQSAAVVPVPKVGSQATVPVSEASGSAQSEAPSSSSHSAASPSVETATELSTAEQLLLGQLQRVCDLPASGEPCKACGDASIMHSFKRILAVRQSSAHAVIERDREISDLVKEIERLHKSSPSPEGQGMPPGDRPETNK